MASVPQAHPKPKIGQVESNAVDSIQSLGTKSWDAVGGSISHPEIPRWTMPTDEIPGRTPMRQPGATQPLVDPTLMKILKHTDAGSKQTGINYNDVL